MSEDKFKVGDKLYWVGVGHDPEGVAIGTVVLYNPNGISWIKGVKYEAEFIGKDGKPHTYYFGNDRSPDVFGSIVLTENEYKLRCAKKEYEEILDHGNGD